MQSKRDPGRPADPRTTLFEQNISWACAIARNVARKLPPSFDPGDLQQEALVETWKLCEKYDPDNERGTPFQAFAYFGVRGAVLMKVRRRGWIEATAEEISMREVDGKPTPEQQLQAKQDDRKQHRQLLRRRGWLRKEVAKLPAAEAYLVQRVYIDEVDLGEIAACFGIERAVLSRRLAGGVKRLQKAAR